MAEQFAHVAALVDGQAGERLVEQQHARALRQRHGDLDAALFAVGGFGQRPFGHMLETDTRQRCARLRDQMPAGDERHHGFQRSGDSPSSASMALRNIVSRGNSVMI